MAEVLYTSFETGADAFSYLGRLTTLTFCLAWQFTTTRAIKLSAGSIYLEGKNGAPSGDITFRIETNVSTLPSGTLVHANATAAIANASVSLAAWNKRTYTPFSLAAGTYWLVIIIDTQAQGNYWKWTRDDDGAGRSAYSSNGGSSWTGNDNQNMPYSRIYRKLLLGTIFME